MKHWPTEMEVVGLIWTLKKMHHLLFQTSKTIVCVGLEMGPHFAVRHLGHLAKRELTPSSSPLPNLSASEDAPPQWNTEENQARRGFSVASGTPAHIPCDQNDAKGKWRATATPFSGNNIKDIYHALSSEDTVAKKPMPTNISPDCWTNCTGCRRHLRDFALRKGKGCSLACADRRTAGKRSQRRC